MLIKFFSDFMTLSNCILYQTLHKCILKKIILNPKKSGLNSYLIRLRGRGLLVLVSKDSPKKFLGLYLIHKSHNVILKLYLELS